MGLPLYVADEQGIQHYGQSMAPLQRHTGSGCLVCQGAAISGADSRGNTGRSSSAGTGMPKILRLSS